jgi:serine/threonine protein kinase
LDLACDDSNALATAYLIKASEWVKAFGSTLKSDAGASDVVQMALDRSKHHVKKLDKEALKKGLGLFSSSSDSHVSGVGPGLQHMGRVLNRLFAYSAAREVAVFPLSVRSPSADSGTEESKCYWLVYEDLAAEGFKIGTPDRIRGSDTYKAFLRALKEAISRIHEAGVLHCDLYPSNIMWKADAAGENVVIRLIDWDNAHCLDEQAFGDKCKAALMEHKPTRSATFGVDHDWKYFDVLSSAINPGEEQWWTDLASNDKRIIDNAFYALFPL